MTVLVYSPIMATSKKFPREDTNLSKPMRRFTPQIPTYDALMLPTLQALDKLGGSGTVDEIYEQVIGLLKFENDVLDILHGDTSQSEVQYRLAWSRTYLKKFGLIDKSGVQRGLWSLTSPHQDFNDFDPKMVVKFVRETHKTKPKQTPDSSLAVEVEEEEILLAWYQQLHKVIMDMSPSAFERLAQRLLRESGFIQVEVTGKSNDGGIDGIGIARIAGFLSFHVLFQCKRYQGSITPSQIRDFRGAMQGRTDKGLFITTGTFTREAVKEATRDGAPPIDLIDGEQLVQRLKELGLGVKIKMVESVEVDVNWFDNI